MISPDNMTHFFARTSRREETECCEWQGAVTASTGYGKVKLDGRVMDTHRAAWILTHGDIAPRMMICHTCDNRRCVNPRHLFLGTRADNMIDAHLKGRIDMAAVRSAASSKISDHEVREIFTRINAGESRAELAARFGVSPTTISKIRHKRVARYADILEDLEVAS